MRIDSPHGIIECVEDHVFPRWLVNDVSSYEPIVKARFPVEYHAIKATMTLERVSSRTPSALDARIVESQRRALSKSVNDAKCEIKWLARQEMPNIFSIVDSTSTKSLFDLFVSLGYPCLNDFLDYIAENIAWNEGIAERATIVSNTHKNLISMIDDMKGVVEPIRQLSRKDIAVFVRGKYDQDQVAICFSILDNKTININQLMEKKLNEQV